MSAYNQNKRIVNILHPFFHTKSLKFSMSFKPTAQLRLNTFQMLCRHMWPVAKILDRTAQPTLLALVDILQSLSHFVALKPN